MAVVTAYNIPNLVGNLLALSQTNISGGLANTYSVESYTSPTIIECGWYSNANALGVLDQSDSMQSGSFSEGAWFGNANTCGVTDVAQQMSGTNAGTWPGNANGSTVYEIPTEDHNTSIITADNPESNQSAALVEWNHFPAPESIPEPDTKPRDLSRFQKSYSFTRQHPVRIRLFRR